MTATIAERPDSRPRTTLEGEQVDLKYNVWGTDDDNEVAALVESTSPEEYDGLPRRNIQIAPNDSETLWECTVHYQKKDPATVDRQNNPPQTGDTVLSFDTAGGTTRITQSIKTIHQYSTDPEKPAPDFKGAIGVTKDGVEGVEIMIPSFQFQLTTYIDADALNEAYITTLFRTTCKTNNSPFRGFAKGEVLLAGVSGSKRGEDDAELTFKFLCSENRTNLTVGSMTGIVKKGWEYLWVLYDESEDEAAGRLVRRPRAAYVEQVYEEANFGGLGL